MGRKNEIEGQISLFDMILQQGNIDTEQGNTDTEPDNRGTEPSSGISQKKKDSSKATKKYKPGEFKECQICWCYSCEHSSIGGGKPRPFGDMEKACPSCEMCVMEGKADICVIDSAEEGCRFRAQKEGLY